MRKIIFFFLTSVYISCNENCICPKVYYKDNKFSIKNSSLIFHSIEIKKTINDSQMSLTTYNNFKINSKEIDIEQNSKFNLVNTDTLTSFDNYSLVYNLSIVLVDTTLNCRCIIEDFYSENLAKTYNSSNKKDMFNW